VGQWAKCAAITSRHRRGIPCSAQKQWQFMITNLRATSIPTRAVCYASTDSNRDPSPRPIQRRYPWGSSRITLLHASLNVISYYQDMVSGSVVASGERLGTSTRPLILAVFWILLAIFVLVVPTLFSKNWFTRILFRKYGQFWCPSALVLAAFKRTHSGNWI